MSNFKNIFLKTKSNFSLTAKCFLLTGKCFSLIGKCFPLTTFSNSKQTQKSLESGFLETTFRETNMALKSPFFYYKLNGLLSYLETRSKQSLKFFFFFMCLNYLNYFAMKYPLHLVWGELFQVQQLAIKEKYFRWVAKTIKTWEKKVWQPICTSVWKLTIKKWLRALNYCYNLLN